MIRLRLRYRCSRRRFLCFLFIFLRFRRRSLNSRLYNTPNINKNTLVTHRKLQNQKNDAYNVPSAHQSPLLPHPLLQEPHPEGRWRRRQRDPTFPYPSCQSHHRKHLRLQLMGRWRCFLQRKYLRSPLRFQSNHQSVCMQHITALSKSRKAPRGSS